MTTTLLFEIDIDNTLFRESERKAFIIYPFIDQLQALQKIFDENVKFICVSTYDTTMFINNFRNVAGNNIPLTEAPFRYTALKALEKAGIKADLVVTHSSHQDPILREKGANARYPLGSAILDLERQIVEGRLTPEELVKLSKAMTIYSQQANALKTKWNYTISTWSDEDNLQPGHLYCKVENNLLMYKVLLPSGAIVTDHISAEEVGLKEITAVKDANLQLVQKITVLRKHTHLGAKNELLAIERPASLDDNAKLTAIFDSFKALAQEEFVAAPEDQLISVQIGDARLEIDKFTGIEIKYKKHLMMHVLASETEQLAGNKLVAIFTDDKSEIVSMANELQEEIKAQGLERSLVHAGVLATPRVVGRIEYNYDAFLNTLVRTTNDAIKTVEENIEITLAKMTAAEFTQGYDANSAVKKFSARQIKALVNLFKALEEDIYYEKHKLSSVSFQMLEQPLDLQNCEEQINRLRTLKNNCEALMNKLNEKQAPFYEEITEIFNKVKDQINEKIVCFENLVSNFEKCFPPNATEIDKKKYQERIFALLRIRPEVGEHSQEKIIEIFTDERLIRCANYLDKKLYNAEAEKHRLRNWMNEDPTKIKEAAEALLDHLLNGTPIDSKHTPIFNNQKMRQLHEIYHQSPSSKGHELGQ